MPMLSCPNCGWDGSADGTHDFCFRYLEEVTAIRRVERLSEAGTLEISGEEHIAIGDPGANARLQCGECLAEFTFPEDLNIDFV